LLARRRPVVTPYLACSSTGTEITPASDAGPAEDALADRAPPDASDGGDPSKAWVRITGFDPECESPDAGVKDLVTYGGDPEHEAVDIGADGADMAWIESSGERDGGTAPWPVIEIMTAKHTTEASVVAVTKRRLRTEYGGTGVSPFVVGCGYAARSASSVQLGNVVRLVRLADGRS
jgi:hypothetical protein